MDCREFSNLLEDYLDGMLPDGDASRLKAHAEKCAECDALLALRMDCRKMDEDVEVPDEFSSAWRQMIREETKMEKQMQKKKSWKTWVATAAAFVFILGGTMLTRDSRPETDPAGGSADYDAVMYRSSDSYDLAAASLKRSADNGVNYAMMDSALYGMENAAEETTEKIIRTVSFTIKTLEYDADLQAIQDIAAGMGGRMEYLSANGEKNSTVLRSAYLTLRIPSEKLDDFIAGAQGVGALTSLTQQSQNISESYYDTAARLETQKQKMDRLNVLLAEAENIADLIEIESAIADTQYWIDHYTGQLNHYDDQVDYSTVNVSLQEVKVAASEEASLFQRIWSALKDSFTEGVAFLGDMVVFVIAAAPWLILAGLVVFVVKKIRKKKKEK